MNAIDSSYAHRLAIMLECMCIDPVSNWDDAIKLVDEYHKAWRVLREKQLGSEIRAFGK